MGRPKIDDYWVHSVRIIIQSEPRKSAKSIEIFLSSIGQRLSRDDWPKERTIRHIAEAFRGLSPEDQQRYSRFHWPEAMTAGLLPWEASAAALELLRTPTKSRPTIRLVTWFYRVTLAVPDAPLEERTDRAIFLAMNEAADSPNPRAYETVEGWMIYRPWTSADAKLKYQEAILAGDVLDERVPIASLDAIELAFWDSKPWASDEVRDYFESRLKQPK